MFLFCYPYLIMEKLSTFQSVRFSSDHSFDVSIFISSPLFFRRFFPFLCFKALRCVSLRNCYPFVRFFALFLAFLTFFSSFFSYFSNFLISSDFLRFSFRSYFSLLRFIDGYLSYTSSKWLFGCLLSFRLGI